MVEPHRTPETQHLEAAPVTDRNDWFWGEPFTMGRFRAMAHVLGRQTVGRLAGSSHEPLTTTGNVHVLSAAELAQRSAASPDEMALTDQSPAPALSRRPEVIFEEEPATVEPDHLFLQRGGNGPEEPRQKLVFVDPSIYSLQPQSNSLRNGKSDRGRVPRDWSNEGSNGSLSQFIRRS